jgi:hypothetical protein
MPPRARRPYSPPAAFAAELPRGFGFKLAKYATTSRISRGCKIPSMGGMIEIAGVWLAISDREMVFVAPSNWRTATVDGVSRASVPPTVEPSFSVTLTNP